MTSTHTPYKPISCEFHDRLEDLATLRKSVRIRLRGENGEDLQRDAVITDVFARDGEEFLSMSTGEAFRLDRLVEVDGARLADYDASRSCALP